MSVIQTKTLARNADNTIDLDAEFSDLNLKAGTLADDVVEFAEAAIDDVDAEVVAGEAARDAVVVAGEVARDATTADGEATRDASQAEREAALQAKADEVMSVNPDGTYYTKTAIDTNFATKAEHEAHLSLEAEVARTLANVPKNLWWVYGADYAAIMSRITLREAGVPEASLRQLDDEDVIQRFSADGFVNGMMPEAMTFTGGANSTFDTDGVLQPSYLDQPAITGGRWASTVAEGAILGGEEVINGGFDSDSDWTKGTGWAIGSGVASCDGTQTGSTYLSQLSLTDGKTYLAIFTVTSASAGGVSMTVSGAQGDIKTTSGTYTEILTANGTSAALKGDVNFVGSIDNISIKEVIPQYLTTDKYGYDLQPSKVIRTAAGLMKEFVTYSTLDYDTQDTFEIGDKALVQTATGPIWLECIGVSEAGEYFSQFDGFDVSNLTFTGGGQVVPDMHGVLRKCQEGVPAIEGGRWAETVEEGAALGEDELLTEAQQSFASGWNYYDGAALDPAFYTDPDGGNNARKLTSSGGGGYCFISGTEGVALYRSVWLKGTGTVRIGAILGGSDSIVLSDTWVQIDREGLSSSARTFQIQDIGASDVLYVYAPSVKEVTPQFVPTIGPELVTNGMFDSEDLSQIGNTNYCSLAVDSGQLKVTTDGVGPFTEFYYTDMLTVGKEYLFSYTSLSTTRDQETGVYSGGYVLPFEQRSLGTYQVTFTAQDTKVGIVIDQDDTSDVHVFDNISVREVYPNYAPHKTKLGEELVTDTSFDDPLEWDVQDSVVADSKLSVVDTTFKAITPSTLVLAVGKSYSITVDVESVNNNGFGLRLGSSSISAAGTYTGAIVSAGITTLVVNLTTLTDQYISIINVSGALTLSLRSVSIKEILPDYTVDDTTDLFGNAMVRDEKLYNDIEAKWFDARTNLLTHSNDFSNAVWSGYANVTANQAIAPDGTLTAALFSAAGSPLYRFSTVSAGQVKSVWARTVSGTGTTSLGGAYELAKYQVELTEQWQRFEFPSDTGESGGTTFYVVDTRHGSLTEVYIWEGQLETGTEATWNIPTEATTITKEAGVYTRTNPLFVKKQLLEPAATNLLTYSEDLTNAAWLKSGGSAGSATELTINAGADTNRIYQNFGTVAADTTVTISIHTKNSVGETVRLAGFYNAAYDYGEDITVPANGIIQRTITPSHSMTYIAIANNIAGTGATLTLADGGGIQLEAGFKTSYIKTEATTITRPATKLEGVSEGVLRGNDIAFHGMVIPKAGDQGGAFYFSNYKDSDAEIKGYIDNTKIYLVKRIGGVNYTVISTHTAHKNVPFQYQAYLSSSYGIGIRVRYWLGLAWSDEWKDIAWITNSNSEDAIIADTYEIGSRNGSSHFAGHYPRFYTLQHEDPKARIEELTDEGYFN